MKTNTTKVTIKSPRLNNQKGKMVFLDGKIISYNNYLKWCSGSEGYVWENSEFKTDSKWDTTIITYIKKDR